MAKIEKAEIERISELSCLQLGEDEKQPMQEDLEKIVDMVCKMQEVNTDGVEPMSSVTDFAALNIKAPKAAVDEVTEHPDREQLQTLTKHTMGGVYLVPQVLGKS
ncbi:MAG: Asp-tRNA(Asn)/Glu-tRNA(Gln) amidotransferase subunit GatC [Alcanivoracaceae bacterium]|nr:Asp-tRNA(Asn)/Glu-tRNA(Gln) amidotransferase subunit GatC [Alcanivoracaceae bacterium]